MAEADLLFEPLIIAFDPPERHVNLERRDKNAGGQQSSDQDPAAHQEAASGDRGFDRETVEGKNRSALRMALSRRSRLAGMSMAG
jgi:hypothetical protein